MRFVFTFLFVSMSVFAHHAFAQERLPSMQDAGTENVAEPDSTVLENASRRPVSSSDVGGIAAPSAILPGDGEDVFFDANDLVPQGEMAKEGPNKVSPILQPASKLVVVKKTHEIDSKEAQLVSAERALTLGRYESALIMLDPLHKASPQDGRVLMGRAVALQKVGRFDEAMKMYEALSKVEPDNLEVKINMLGLLGTRYPAIALRRLKDLADQNASHPGLAAQLAFAYAQNGDVRSALRYLGVASSLEPTNANHVFNQAVIADRAGERDAAIKFYEKALEVDTIYGGGRTIPREAVYTRLGEIR